MCSQKHQSQRPAIIPLHSGRNDKNILFTHFMSWGAKQARWQGAWCVLLKPSSRMLRHTAASVHLPSVALGRTSRRAARLHSQILCDSRCAFSVCALALPSSENCCVVTEVENIYLTGLNLLLALQKRLHILRLFRNTSQPTIRNQW